MCLICCICPRRIWLKPFTYVFGFLKIIDHLTVCGSKLKVFNFLASSNWWEACCLLVFSVAISSTAAATFRQAVALIFDHVVHAEALPVGKFGCGHISRSSSVTGDVSRSMNHSEYVNHHVNHLWTKRSNLMHSVEILS